MSACGQVITGLIHPLSGVWWCGVYSYGEFKRLVTSVTGGDELSPSVGEKFVSGAAAGAVSQVQRRRRGMTMSCAGLTCLRCSLFGGAVCVCRFSCTRWRSPRLD